MGILRLGQGKENARDFLLENPDVLEEVDARVRDSLGLGDDPEVEENFGRTFGRSLEGSRGQRRWLSVGG